MEVILDTIVPIKSPKIELQKEKSVNGYMFDKNNRFISYKATNIDGTFFQDDQNKWYFMTSFESDDVFSMKYSRQVMRPDYIEDNVDMPLLEKLELYKIQPDLEGFDKAIAHLSVNVTNLKNTTALFQSKCANIDGEDDPQVCHQIHFLSTHYKNKETRFITGWETKSFATITDNEFYFKNIHMKSVSKLYLLYFAYFTNYNFVPSQQMLPKLLENLWLSGKSGINNYNDLLFKKEVVNLRERFL
jgi:hypothetical protein